MDKCGIEFRVFDRYEHRRRDVDAAIVHLFLNGLSARRLKVVAKGLWGKEISPRTVSNAFSALEKELERFKDKPLDDTVEFLFLDGISQMVREIGIEKKVMLCALGTHLKKPGVRQQLKEILSFQLMDVKGEASWKGLLADLKARGLLGKRLKLSVTDGNPALLKTMKQVYRSSRAGVALPIRCALWH